MAGDSSDWPPTVSAKTWPAPTPTAVVHVSVLTVNVGVWTYAKPLPQAKYLAKKDAVNYNGYKRQHGLDAWGYRAGAQLDWNTIGDLSGVLGADTNRRRYLDDVTSAVCTVGVWGPRAREIVQPATRTNLANAAFPFLIGVVQMF